MQVAEKAPPGSVILCMLPDTGERYLTTPLFEGISRGHGRGGNAHLQVDAGLSDAGSIATSVIPSVARDLLLTKGPSLRSG